MRILFSIILVTLVSTFSFAQTTTLGTQVWSTKNLDVTTFRNGDPIFYAQTDEDWEKAGANGQPAWSFLYMIQKTKKPMASSTIGMP